MDIEVDTEDTLSGALAVMGDAIRTALMDTTQALADQLIATAVDLLPDGPLAASLVATIDADESSVTATIASDLPYAAFQNYGFTGVEQVRESLRRQSVAFGRPMTPREVLVRAHARRVDAAGTDFLTGPLDAMADDIAAAYDGAVGQVLNP